NVAIIVSRWSAFVVKSLLSGAIDTLKCPGVADAQISIIRAPGAFEIPLVCKKIAEQKKFDAIIALGAVIRGGTPHFEYVAGECSKGRAQAMMEYGGPVAFGLVSVDSNEQAIERCGSKPGSKGA